jgi:hypothetical protein
MVHVNPNRDAVANIAFGGTVLAAGATLDVPQNMPITLDGGQSLGAADFTWTQVGSGPTVNLGPTANQAKLTFTVPKRTAPLTLQLQVRRTGVAPGACTPDVTCDTVTVVLRPEPDTLTTTKARFVVNGSRWVIDGTATSTNSNKVTVYSGRAIDNPAMQIGTSDVLAVDNTWSVDVRDSTVPLTDCACVTAVSDRGGIIVAQLEKANALPPSTIPAGDPPVQSLAARAPLTAAVPLVGAARLAAARVTTPASVTTASIAATGVPVTVNVPTGATLVRLRVLSAANKALLTTFKQAKGGTKFKVNLRSAKLRKQLRSGRRFVIEVRAGTAKNRLGKPTRKVIRVR